MLQSLWGRPPGLRGTPPSRGRSNDIGILQSASRPTGASAAVRGDCPTINAGAWWCENYVASGWEARSTNPVLGLDEARADGVSHHAGGLVDAQLFQDPAAVRVGCLVADPQLRRSLFGRFAVGDEHQHLAFPFRQGEDDAHRLRVRDEPALPAVGDIGHRAHESGKLAVSVVARHSRATTLTAS